MTEDRFLTVVIEPGEEPIISLWSTEEAANSFMDAFPRVHENNMYVIPTKPLVGKLPIYKFLRRGKLYLADEED